jgi:hypothetical protein
LKFLLATCFKILLAKPVCFCRKLGHVSFMSGRCGVAMQGQLAVLFLLPGDAAAAIQRT